MGDGATGSFAGWPTILGRLTDGGSLDRSEARAALSAILEGEATEAQIAAFIVAIRQKGESVDELAGMVDAMSDAATPLSVPEGCIDIVGTGGSPQRKVRALNVSTMSSFVAAAAGAVVCKHGNLRASSTSGSFDLLDALGVPYDQTPEGLRERLDELGIGFAFARAYHPAMRHAGPVRAQLGIPTVFNVLGPLSHPGRVARQVIGVGDPRLVDLVAGTVAARGAVHTLVVHGDRSLDEIAVTGPTELREVRDGVVVDARTFDPAEVGIGTVAVEQVPGGDRDANVAILHDTFAGAPGPARDLVCCNAGAGLYVAGIVPTLADGVALARATIDSGAAADLVARSVGPTGA